MKRVHFKVQFYEPGFPDGQSAWTDDVTFTLLARAKSYAWAEMRRTKQSHRVVRVVETVVTTYYKQKGAS